MDKEQKDKIIKKETRELKKIFKNVEDNKKRFVDSLINQVAFMSATLYELNDSINCNGSIQWITNGNGQTVKSDLEMKTYNATVKSFQSAMKQLIDLLPEDEESDEITEFINAHKK